MSQNFIICYDKSTGEQVRAFESPLEPGVYLHPANSTTLEPPMYDPSFEVLKFVNDSWLIENINIPNLFADFNNLTDNQKIAKFYQLDEDDIEGINSKISEIGGKESPMYDSIVNPPLLNNKTSYIELRKQAYGDVESQIEYITENGLDAWQDKVKKIKQLYPKNNDIVS